MEEVISACGVLCSGCAAYNAASKGPAFQKEVADAWYRIYGLEEQPERISCGGCLSRDDQVFHTSVRCAARRCCRGRGLHNCGECPEKSCEVLANTEHIWDAVPEVGANLSPADFDRYARPYCGHRERLAAIRRAGM